MLKKTMVYDGVLYIYDEELGEYVEEHDVLDDIVEMFEKEENDN